jgi:hypothetical protein
MSAAQSESRKASIDAPSIVSNSHFATNHNTDQAEPCVITRTPTSQ